VVAGPAVVGGGFVYANPYYVNPAFTAEDPYTHVTPDSQDYSRPLAVPSDAEEEKTSGSVVSEAMDAFGRARTSFKKGRYEDATVEVERALKLLPGDHTMQEFRALALFARGRYTEAAGVIYAVLAAGPGWDEDTLMMLYPSEKTYPKQFQALKDYVLDHPREAAAHFLLAYHHLVREEHDAALAELRLAGSLSPGDKLSGQLARALAGKAKDTEWDEE
jgi:tetratricopeptide (TPR) repeat protein